MSIGESGVGGVDVNRGDAAAEPGQVVGVLWTSPSGNSPSPSAVDGSDVSNRPFFTFYDS